MTSEHLSVVEKLAAATDTAVEDWESMFGPESRVGVDFWYRHRPTGVEAYANLDQTHLIIAVDGQRVYDGA